MYNFLMQCFLLPKYATLYQQYFSIFMWTLAKKTAYYYSTQALLVCVRQRLHLKLYDYYTVLHKNLHNNSSSKQAVVFMLFLYNFIFHKGLHAVPFFAALPRLLTQSLKNGLRSKAASRLCIFNSILKSVKKIL